MLSGHPLLFGVLIFYQTFSTVNCTPKTAASEKIDVNNSYKISKAAGKKIEWLVDQKDLPVNGSFEYFVESMSQLNPSDNKTFSLRFDAVKENYKVVVYCSFSNISTVGKKWIKLEWRLTEGGVYCSIGQHYYWDVPANFDNYKKFSIRFDTEHPPSYIRNIILENSPVTGCPPKIPVSHFKGNGLLCNETETSTTTERKNRVTTLQSSRKTTTPWKREYLEEHDDDYENFHISTGIMDKIEWILDPKSLPISGSIEFLTTNVDSNYYFPLVTDLVLNETIANCNFDFGDGKWHRINWTLYGKDNKDGSLLHCESDRPGEYVKTWYYQDVKKLSIRMDFQGFSATDPYYAHTPTCLRNLQIQDSSFKSIKTCFNVTYPNLTTSAAICGCSQFPGTIMNGPKTTQAPEIAYGNSLYQFSKKKGTKVEWLVDYDSLPVSGSFEYFSNPMLTSSYYSTHALRIDDAETGVMLAWCTLLNQTDSYTKWLKVDWQLESNSLRCSIDGENGGNLFDGTEKRNLSIRFDTEQAPAYIRTIVLQNKMMAGCPAKPPVDNFTATGLLCDYPGDKTMSMPSKSSGKTRKPENGQKTTSRAPEVANGNNLYQISKQKGKKVEWRVDYTSLPVSGSFEYFTNLSSSSSFLTHPLRVDDADTKENVGRVILFGQNHTQNSKWMKFEWSLDKESFNYNVDYEYNGFWFGDDQTSKHRNYSIRFDTNRAPTFIRNVILQKKKMTGCPAVPPVDNFTITGLLCDSPYETTPQSEHQKEYWTDSPQPIADHGPRTTTPWNMGFLDEEDDYDKEVQDAMCLREIFLMNFVDMVAGNTAQQIATRMVPHSNNVYMSG